MFRALLRGDFLLSATALRRSLHGISGLDKNLHNAMMELGHQHATSIQRHAFPILHNSRATTLIASGTGSGKTLAALLPVWMRMKEEEREREGEQGPGERESEPETAAGENDLQRPRLLLLTPSRELSVQHFHTCKALGHHSGLRVRMSVGGREMRRKTKKTVQDNLVDVLIGTPGNILEMQKNGDLYLSRVTRIIVDEADVLMTENGFRDETMKILSPWAVRFQEKLDNASTPELRQSVLRSHHLILLTASLTSRLRNALSTLHRRSPTIGPDLWSELNPEGWIGGRATPLWPEAADTPWGEMLGKGSEESGEKASTTPSDSAPIRLPVIQVSGHEGSLHRVPKLLHIEWKEDVADKPAELVKVLQALGHTPSHPSPPRTLIFCNTLASARHCEHTLTEEGVAPLSLHSGVPPLRRKEEWDAFVDSDRRSGPLVCTDLASRGLDLRDVENVIIYDLPKSPVEFLHRVGRTARAGDRGTATVLVSSREKGFAQRLRTMIDRNQELFHADDIDDSPTPTRASNSHPRSSKGGHIHESRQRFLRDNPPGSSSTPSRSSSTPSRSSRGRRPRLTGANNTPLDMMALRPLDPSEAPPGNNSESGSDIPTPPETGNNSTEGWPQMPTHMREAHVAHLETFTSVVKDANGRRESNDRDGRRRVMRNSAQKSFGRREGERERERGRGGERRGRERGGEKWGGERERGGERRGRDRGVERKGDRGEKWGKERGGGEKWGRERGGGGEKWGRERGGGERRGRDRGEERHQNQRIRHNNSDRVIRELRSMMNK